MHLVCCSFCGCTFVCNSTRLGRRCRCFCLFVCWILVASVRLTRARKQTDCVRQNKKLLSLAGCVSLPTTHETLLAHKWCAQKWTYLWGASVVLSVRPTEQLEMDLFFAGLPFVCAVCVVVCRFPFAVCLVELRQSKVCICIGVSCVRSALFGSQICLVAVCLSVCVCLCVCVCFSCLRFGRWQ